MNNLEFIELKAHWNKILADEGLPEEPSTFSAANIARSASWHDAPQILAYYDQAQEFLKTHHFTTPFERRVWRLHSQGISLSKIVSAIGTSKSHVGRIVRRLRTKMLNRDILVPRHHPVGPTTPK